MSDTQPTADIFAGCLLGGALGDALGYPVEFVDDWSVIRAQHGREPPAELNYSGTPLGLISDDTQMTLFSAEGMIRAYQRAQRGICHGPSVIASAYQRWYATQVLSGPTEKDGWLITEPRLYARRAPGNTCLSALKSLCFRGGPLPTLKTPPNDSKGCGAVMRVAPMGLAATSYVAAWELALETSVLTHGHPSGYLAAGYFAGVVWDLAHGASLEEAMAHAHVFVGNFRGHEELLSSLDRARFLALDGPPTPDDIGSMGGGWTGEQALGIALLCAMTFDPNAERGFERALWRAVVHKGDSDSTGSIAGNLLGVQLGRAPLPQRWLEKLEVRDVVERIATDLHQAVSGAELDDADYPGR